MPEILKFILIFVFALLSAVLFLLQLRTKKRLTDALSQCEVQKTQLNKKVTEGNFFLGLDDRLGHLMDLRQVIDSITDSLQTVIPYSAVSYMLIEGKKVFFKCTLNESVSRDYINDIKKRMTNEMKALVDYDLKSRPFEEAVLGKFISNDNSSGINSFYTVELNLGPEVIGLFNISSTVPDQYKDTERGLLKKILEKAMDSVYTLKKLLVHEQGKLSSMIESMNDGVLMLNKDLQILMINPACYSLMNVDTTYVVTIFDIIGSFSSAFALEEKVNLAFETGKTSTYDDIKVRDRYLQIVVIPIKSDGVAGAVGVLIHDLTQEEEYKRMEIEFTAMMVHELRSPLTVIRGTADMVLKNLGTLSQEQITMLFGQIKSSSSNLLDIVNDLLDTAKAESGKLQLMKTFIDLNKMLGDQAVYYSNSAKEKGLDILTDFDPTVGLMNVDEDKIKQVLNNLLSNSLKFTERGGNIILSTKRSTGFIEVSISDTGKGISDSSKAKLFSKFMQFKDRSSLEKGTGLGLVIAKGIIEAHGGRIWVEDNIPRGTKFIFTLPVQAN